jgi:hypothetical protein
MGSAAIPGDRLGSADGEDAPPVSPVAAADDGDGSAGSLVHPTTTRSATTPTIGRTFIEPPSERPPGR